MLYFLDAFRRPQHMNCIAVAQYMSGAVSLLNDRRRCYLRRASRSRLHSSSGRKCVRVQYNLD